MPTNNSIRNHADESYFHLYNRGVNKERIFLDIADYRKFEQLLQRYLDVNPTQDEKGREYEHLRGKVELLTYCLMPNHIHLLLYVKESDAMSRLLSGIMTAYSMYFNKKYKRVGHLFQSRFQAAYIDNEAYLQHISRYIHMNPYDYLHYEYSSLADYLGRRSTSWLQPEDILAIFNHDPNTYNQFLKDYHGRKGELEEIKHMLADQ